MNTIWKFPLTLEPKQAVKMPEGAIILSAQTQGIQLCLWAMVNSDAKTESRTIFIFGTGCRVPLTDLQFSATAQMGQFVWHIFEHKEAA